jgi:hypothetical protein
LADWLRVDTAHLLPSALDGEPPLDACFRSVAPPLWIFSVLTADGLAGDAAPRRRVAARGRT